MVYDQNHDPSFSVLQSLVREFPEALEFVKTAQLGEAEPATDEAFAWPEEGRFPVTSREQTALSLLYFTKCASAPAHVGTNLEKAREIYGLQELKFQTKVAADDVEDYLLPDLRRFRVKTAAEVLPAAVAVERNYRKMSIPHRALACQRLLEKAAAFKVELPGLFQRMAGRTLSSAPVLLEALEMRKEASAKTPVVQEAFSKLAGLVAAMPPDEFQNPEILNKLAGALTRLDTKAGLHPRWGKTLEDPLLSVFNTEKVAEPALSVAGRSVPVSTLANLPAAAYEDVFGPEFTAEAFPGGEPNIEQLLNVLPTMPADLQRVFARNLPA